MERTIVILGAGGRLGAALQRAYAQNFAVTAFNHGQLELSDEHKIRSELGPRDFDLLINCAALTDVDYCESHRAEAFTINAEAPRLLAQMCARKQATLVHISTDYVFDGKKRAPYGEEVEPIPVSAYGESKLEGERAVLETDDRFLVVRVSWVFGPDRPSFVDQVIARARESAEVAAVADKFSTPTYTLDLADWLRIAWNSGASGLLHLANGGECSWQEYAQHALNCCRECGIELRGRRVAPLSLGQMTNFVARRPIYTVLSTEKFARLSGVQPRSWRDAVADYVKEHVARK